MIDLLHDFYFVLKHVYVWHIHLLHFDDLDGVPDILHIIPYSFVDSTAEATPNDILEIKAILSYPLLTLIVALYYLIPIALLNLN